MENSIYSDRAPDPVGAYPHAKKAGNLLFLSGVGPRKKKLERDSWRKTL